MLNSTHLKKSIESKVLNYKIRIGIDERKEKRQKVITTIKHPSDVKKLDRVSVLKKQRKIARIKNTELLKILNKKYDMNILKDIVNRKKNKKAKDLDHVFKYIKTDSKRVENTFLQIIRSYFEHLEKRTLFLRKTNKDIRMDKTFLVLTGQLMYSIVAIVKKK